MKQIFLKTLYSFIGSTIIFNTITLLKGYFNPIQSIIIVVIINILVLLVSLVELASKSNESLKLIPHIILMIVLFVWAWISPDFSDGNDFYIGPLSVGVVQGIIAGLEIKKQLLNSSIQN